MSELPADYLVEIEQKARRYSGAYTGTCGSLAGGVLLLLKERESMQAAIQQLERDNQALRSAVESRLAARQAGDDPDPVCVQGMGKSAMEAAWAGVKERHAQLHDNIRTYSAPASQAAPTAAAAAVSTPAEQLISDAMEAIRDRRTKYGPPVEHFTRTVGMINALFASKLREPLTPEDWAQIMILDKLSRNAERPIRDNQTDTCGYAACWAECAAAAGANRD